MLREFHSWVQALSGQVGIFSQPSYVFVRSSDTSESTRARLDGITLDVARPAASASPLRPAVGVEQCDCPPQYNATSCQDPGRG